MSSGPSKGSIHLALRNNFHLFPYRLYAVQEIREGDYETRAEFANWYLQNIESDEFLLKRIIFSDEGVSHVDGNVNKQNARIRDSENLHETTEVSPDSRKVAVWCAVSIGRVIGPYHNDGSIVTADSYLQLLN